VQVGACARRRVRRAACTRRSAIASVHRPGACRCCSWCCGLSIDRYVLSWKIMIYRYYNEYRRCQVPGLWCDAMRTPGRVAAKPSTARRAPAEIRRNDNRWLRAGNEGWRGARPGRLQPPLAHGSPNGRAPQTGAWGGPRVGSDSGRYQLMPPCGRPRVLCQCWRMNADAKNSCPKMRCERAQSRRSSPP